VRENREKKLAYPHLMLLAGSPIVAIDPLLLLNFKRANLLANRCKVRRLEYAQFGSLAGHTSVLQHQAIIAACEQGQPEQAALLIEQNWLSLRELIVKSFDTDNVPAKRKDT
jgi:DNA-binding GntR family transcriptional regulator